MDTSKMTNKDITLLMAGRFVDANRVCLYDHFTSSEIIYEIPGALTAKQAYTALVSLCADGYCKKVGPGKFALTESGLEHYNKLEDMLEDCYDDEDYDHDYGDDEEDEEEIETVEPAWKTAYDAAMKAYNAAMDAYQTAMSSI